MYFLDPFYYENFNNVPFKTNIRRDEGKLITEDTNGEIVDNC